MSLFEQFDEIMTDKLVEKISVLANDTSINSYKSLQGIYYTLIAGLIRRGNSTMSSNMLYNQVQRNGQKGALVDGLEAAVKDEQTFSTLVSKGNKMLSQVFPAFKSPLISMVSTYAETPKPAAVAYSGFLAGFLIDMLDKKITSENLNAEQLTYYLQKHHQPLLSDSPEGLLEVMIPALGLQELRNVKFATPKRGTHRDEEEVETPVAMEHDTDYDDMARRRGISAPTVIGLVVAILAIGAFAWWYFNIRQNNITDADVAVATEVPVYVADSAVLDSSAAVNAVTENTSFGQSLTNSLNSTSSAIGLVIPMTGVEFTNGTTVVDPSSKAAIEALQKVLAETPQLQIRILGHDVAGNKAAATKRAYAIKRELLDRGGDNNRIDAAGTTDSGKNAVSIKILSK